MCQVRKSRWTMNIVIGKAVCNIDSTTPINTDVWSSRSQSRNQLLIVFPCPGVTDRSAGPLTRLHYLSVVISDRARPNSAFVYQVVWRVAYKQWLDAYYNVQVRMRAGTDTLPDCWYNRSINAIFGEVGHSVYEEIPLQLAKRKYLPIFTRATLTSAGISCRGEKYFPRFLFPIVYWQ